MKDRIELFAANIICTIPDQIAAPVYESSIREITRAVNEALELAARECDRFANESSNPMNFSENCAAAIRKMKVK